MNLDEIKPYIIEKQDDHLILDIWNPMLANWNLKINMKEQSNSLGNFLSKMMEFQRACIEEGDNVNQIKINQSLNLCSITIEKYTGELWSYQLSPYGYQGNWEVFNVNRKKR